MKIRYFGHSCFELELNNGTKIISDPFTKIGYELPEGLKADIVTVSHGHFDHNYLNAVVGEPVCLKNSRFFEGKGVKIKGIDSWHDNKKGELRGENTIYKFYAEDITVCHFGDLGEDCTQGLIEQIGQVDVLMLPIGGTYTINEKTAKTYVEKLAPKIILPMHYKGKDCILDIQDEKEFLTLFAEELPIIESDALTLDEEMIKKGEQKIVLLRRIEGV